MNVALCECGVDHNRTDHLKWSQMVSETSELTRLLSNTLGDSRNQDETKRTKKSLKVKKKEPRKTKRN